MHVWGPVTVNLRPAKSAGILQIYVPSVNYTNPGYGLSLVDTFFLLLFFIVHRVYIQWLYNRSLVDTLWNAGSYRQPLEQEGNPMT